MRGRIDLFSDNVLGPVVIEGYRLANSVYEPIAPDASARLWSQTLSLYLGIHDGQLRYFSESGDLIPTPQEYAAHTVLLAQTAEQRALQLERQLREMGVDPDL